MSLLERLKSHARKLARAAAEGNAAALKRLERHSELRGLTPPVRSLAAKRRHSLAVVAMECGFSGWSHLTHILNGATEGDFGKLLHSERCFAHSNVWFASYQEARAVRIQHGGYLLPYKRQFLVVDRYYLETLGLDPEDPAWQALGRDWVSPLSHDARESLYAQLILPRISEQEPAQRDQRPA